LRRPLFRKLTVRANVDGKTREAALHAQCGIERRCNHVPGIR
jgi:hypothetical protein